MEYRGRTQNQKEDWKGKRIWENNILRRPYHLKDDWIVVWRANMQDLERILEEIEKTMEKYKENPRMEVVYICYGLKLAENIIRKCVSGKDNNAHGKTSDYQVKEYCLHCKEEVAAIQDVEKDGDQIYCPKCGKKIMLSEARGLRLDTNIWKPSASIKN